MSKMHSSAENPIVLGTTLWQRPINEVAAFWDTSAEWRVSYFEDLKNTIPASLSPAIQAERSFALLEETVVTETLTSPGLTVELGCGVGRSLWLVAARLPHHPFVGIDFAHHQLELMRRELVSRGYGNIQPVCADVAHVPLRGEVASTVLILNQTFGTFLGHSRQLALHEVLRILKPKGLVVIGGFDAVELAPDCYAQWAVPLLTSNRSIGFFQLAHYNSFWQRQAWLELELKEAGLQVVRGERCELGYVLVLSSS